MCDAGVPMGVPGAQRVRLPSTARRQNKTQLQNGFRASIRPSGASRALLGLSARTLRQIAAAKACAQSFDRW